MKTSPCYIFISASEREVRAGSIQSNPPAWDAERAGEDSFRSMHRLVGRIEEIGVCGLIHVKSMMRIWGTIFLSAECGCQPREQRDNCRGELMGSRVKNRDIVSYLLYAAAISTLFLHSSVVSNLGFVVFCRSLVHTYSAASAHVSEPCME
ncbi:hypothetical protein MPTK1_6g07680 [Marchantia polymorpha subsp. ruderalis]|uniref:Uncharacterized protein n=2 Tax=Marchantia polymorpha TaxID=3197 RepID=A0AAF6BPL8_MARPO|nr:hypothetical protein MARPO_0053s0081 [Marchantia polymorpha]BBN13952.1 hypothetical protein Mp_6g07680 [Marchantia polymorpha subsp. ruderalis]|eukprot:PTQ38153.1 hypothetical protein MARPO_0053s0081 [Marchantia polymorpha]